MLTKRSTKKEYTQQGNHLVKSKKTPSLFSEKPYPNLIRELISNSKIASSMQAGIEEILLTQQGANREIKIERAKKFIAICEAGQPTLEEIQKDESKLTELQTMVSEMQKQFKKTAEDEPSFIQHLASTLGTQALGNFLNSVIPGGALLLAALPVAAAVAQADRGVNPNNIAVFNGIPNGGADLCGGNFLCRQAYLVDGANPTGFLAQTSTTVQAIGTGNGPDLAFLDCCTATNVGLAIKNLFGGNNTGTGLNCFANSALYHNTQATAQVTNFPYTDCSKFQIATAPVFNKCINYSASVGMWVGVGFAALVGAGALVVASICIGRCLRDKCRN